MIVVLQVVQLATASRVNVVTLSWIVLAVGATMMLVGFAELAVVYRRRKLQALHSGRDEDAT